MKRLYFAYGANLNKESMASRCPAATPIGKAIACGKKRVFRGVADVIPGKPEDCVFGALWEITPACEKSLDRFEGYPRLYTKQMIHVWCAESQEVVRAMIYVMTSPKRPIAPPSIFYHETIEQGTIDFGWPNSVRKELNRQAVDAEVAYERAWLAKQDRA